MAQKDYVSRGHSRKIRRKKQGSHSNVSKLMVVLAAAVLLAFAGGLWFLAKHQKDSIPVIPNHQTSNNGLPSKPEERWRYIKELENRQINVSKPTEPSSGSNVQPTTQLTHEQRQLLQQMQADMRQQPIQLKEVPWNDSPSLYHSMDQQQKQAGGSSIPLGQHPAQSDKQQGTAKTKEISPVQNGLVQCGSFKNEDQAQFMRATLAFEGFESSISSNSGGYRVIIKSQSYGMNTDVILTRLHQSGHSNCIPLVVGG